MVTPFSGNDVDSEKMKLLAENLLSKGIDYIFLCGTTGLGPALSFTEKLGIMHAMEPYADRIIFQVGSLNLSESVELAAQARKSGYLAVASLPPYYYFDVPEQWIVRHLSKISEKHRLYAYNFPAASNNRIEPHMISEINRGSGDVIGIKETLTDVSHMMMFKEALGEGFQVFSGPDQLMVPALRSGIDGAVGSCSNYIPNTFAELINNYDKESAIELQMKVNEALTVVKSHGAWSANYSAIRILEKIDPGSPRPPIFPLDPEEEEKLESELEFLKH